MGTSNSVDASFPDAREFDIRSCCRLFANCAAKTPVNGLVLGNMNVWIPTTGGGATMSLDSSYSEQSAQSYKINIADVGELRGAVSDRIGGANQNLLAGWFEMDCTARIKWASTKDGSDSLGNTVTDETVPRIGFTQGHITYFPLTHATPGPFGSCIAFTNFGTETTWFAHLSVNGDAYVPPMEGKGPIFYERRVNTGVPINQWNTLHVWVRGDGKQVKFYANGVLVHEENNSAYIPRMDNFVFASTILSGSVTGSSLNNGGFTLRGDQSVAVPIPVELDWVRTRYFVKR